MTDAEYEAAEFCLCTAVMIKEAETLPSWNSDGSDVIGGLCEVIFRACDLGLISADSYRVVRRPLRNQRPKAALLNNFWWPKGDWRPRVRALRRMAQDIIDNAQRKAKCPKR